MNNYWFRRRWADGRQGHSVYLLFPLTIGNFVLIAYRFLIEQDPLLEKLISDLWFFGTIFLITYFPISIIIGYWHRKTQLKVDSSIKFLNNPIYSKMFRTLIDVKMGNIKKEEIEDFRNSLLEVERKSFGSGIHKE